MWKLEAVRRLDLSQFAEVESRWRDAMSLRELSLNSTWRAPLRPSTFRRPPSFSELHRRLWNLQKPGTVGLTLNRLANKRVTRCRSARFLDRYCLLRSFSRSILQLDDAWRTLTSLAPKWRATREYLTENQYDQLITINIFTVLSILAKQIINLLPLSRFYPVMYRWIQKEDELLFGRSLWSVNQLLALSSLHNVMLNASASWFIVGRSNCVSKRMFQILHLRYVRSKGWEYLWNAFTRVHLSYLQIFQLRTFGYI